LDTASVFHIDPNQLFREGLRQLLRDSNFYMSGQAKSLTEGLSQIAAESPNIVMIDINGDDGILTTLMDGLDELPQRPHVVVLTEAFCLPSLTAALCEGVDGYLLKNMSPTALEQSLNLVLTGEKVFPTDLAHLLINNRFVTKSNGGADKNNGGSLSDRESEILSYLVNGNSNKSIANSLNLTEGTVKVHLKTILKKIHVSNRTQAAIWALRNGIVANVVSGAEKERAMKVGSYQ
jgi:two-component system nitrate/nitrite response regulator NarL